VPRGERGARLRGLVRRATQGFSVRRRAILVLSLALSIAANATSEEALDWSRYAEHGVVTVTTTNRDGSARHTKAWLAVLEGRGYLRTGGTRWGGNIERDPEISLLVGSDSLDLRVHFVTDEATREAVKRAFREKYGFTDWAINLFRGNNPRIMLLEPRTRE
jgi:hypothetical protein